MFAFDAENGKLLSPFPFFRKDPSLFVLWQSLHVDVFCPYVSKK